MVLAFRQHLFVRSEKAMQSYANESRVQNKKRSFWVCLCRVPPNFGLSKVTQTSAECRQTYVKLVQGVYARDNDTLSDKN
jgi:hypothetical protein